MCVQRHGLGPGADRPAFGLRDLQQGGQHALHVVHVAQQQLQRVPLRTRQRRLGAQRLLHAQAHAVHRAAQVVSRAVQGRAKDLRRAREPRQQSVHLDGQGIELVVVTGNRQPAARLPPTISLQLRLTASTRASMRWLWR